MGDITRAVEAWAAAAVPQMPRLTVRVTTPPDSTGSDTIWAISSSRRTQETKSRVLVEWAPAERPVPRELTNGQVVGAPAGRLAAALATRTVVVAVSSDPERPATGRVAAPAAVGLAVAGPE